MYYPFFRGKQFELVLLREQASFLAANNIRPIIEPVKENLASLNRVISEFVNNDVKFTLIINPTCGELESDSDSIFELAGTFASYNGLSLGYTIDAYCDQNKAKQLIMKNPDNNFSMIHYGFSDGKGLSNTLKDIKNIKQHIFVEKYSGKMYRRWFEGRGTSKILIRDGFIVRKNKDYPDSEHFSDLHITYKDEKMDGFGDFLIVGDEYSEAGGPAYAVAIHLTYLDEEEDMHVRHFVSDTQDSPLDPARKFGEALYKLVNALRERHSLIYQSRACHEYIDLQSRDHFPGLGYVKKLSMQHHLELIADFLRKK